MADEKLEIITPPNTLKAKVKIGGPGAVDEEKLARAEQAIQELADEYLDWVVQDLDKIEKAFADLKAAGEHCEAEILAVYQVSHDIKGQGGSFGYDLMTAIGNQLCRMIEKRKTADAELLEAIRVHIDAMQLVINEKINGPGGAAGEHMLAGLKMVYEKVVD